MELFIITSLLTFIGSCVLIYIFGNMGVICACALSSLVFPFCYLALKGFGNPTGYSPKFSLTTYCYTALIVFLYSLLIYYGIYLLRNLLLKEDIPSLLTKVWLGLFLIVASTHGIKNIYKSMNDRVLNITVGYNEDSGIEMQDIHIFLIKGNKKNKLHRNSSGGSLIKNTYGFTKYAGYHFKPNDYPSSIEISLLNKNKTISMAFPPKSQTQSNENIKIFIDKDFVIKLLSEGELFMTQKMTNL